MNSPLEDRLLFVRADRDALQVRTRRMEAKIAKLQRENEALKHTKILQRRVADIEKVLVQLVRLGIRPGGAS